MSAVAWAAVAPAVASATDGPIRLSVDGRHWRADLPELFAGTGAWVPGDVEVRGFYLRNDGPTSADLRIAAKPSSDSALAEDFRFAARVDDGPWRRLGPEGSGRASRAVNTTAIPSAAVRHVQIRALFDAAAVNSSQAGQVDLEFAITLAQVLPPAEQGGGGDGAGLELLPDTGAGAYGGPTWWGLALAGAGAALVARSRRREADHG